MSIPGQADVGGSGAFSYSIPIVVPPGTANMVPGLALAYSSQGGDGYAGLGWAVAGLASISRCPRSVADDGVHGSVNFDANDRFCLNGQKLTAVSGTYGADGTVYRQLSDNFARIVSHGTAGSGPAYFTAQLRNGIVLEFGNTSDSAFKPLKADGSGVSSSVMQWALDKSTDIRGNYYTVTYTNDTTNSQIYVSRIDYTGNAGAGLSAYNSVQFSYMDRPDVAPFYQAGTYITVTKLLTHIKTYAGASVVTDYQLAYNYASSGASHDELSTVKQCDASGVTCLAPTTFTWQGSRDAPSLNSGVDVSAISQGFAVQPGDFTGSASSTADGLTDVLVPDTSCPTHGVIWAGSSSGGFSRAGMAASYDYYQPDDTTMYSRTGDACFLDGAPAVADFNGDGYSDVVMNEAYWIFFNGDDEWEQQFYTNVLLNGKSGTITQATSTRSLPTPMILGDFDGDGRMDGYVQQTSSGNAYFSNGDGSFTVDSGESGYGATTVIHTGDFDGDGCTDILGQGATNAIHYFCNPAVSSASAPAFGSSTVVTGDFNGDGKTDVLAVSSTGATLYFATGTGFTSAVSFSYSGTPSLANWHNYTIVTGDFNGDGKTDIALISKTSGTAHAIALSTGTGFVPLATIANGDTTATAVVADWNNDGADDLWLQFASSTHDTEYTFAYTPELIAGVDNGVGATIAASYDRINKNGTFYTRGTSASFPQKDFDGPSYVVSELDRSNGIGGSYAHTYSYAGAISDSAQPASLGPSAMLGFSSVSVSDPQTGTVTTTDFHTDRPYLGLVASRVETRGGVTLSSLTNTYAAVTTSGSAKAVELTESVLTRKDIDGTSYPTVTTDYSYDAYANPATVTTSVSDGSSEVVTNTYANDTTDWLLGQLTAVSDERIVGTSDITRHYSLTLGTSGGGTLGLVTASALEPGTGALELDSTYTYDSFGNRLTTTLDGTGVTTRTPSTLTYDSQGRFVTTITDALGNTASVSHNADFGTVAGATDVDSLTTGFTYDSFGRVTSATAKDGTRAGYAYAYCSGVNGGSMACPSRGAFAVTTTPLKTDGATQNGAITIAYFDGLGRGIATDIQGFDGSWIRQEVQYDADLHVAQTSRPYFLSGGVAQWTVFSYVDSTSGVDPAGRVWKATAPDGSVTTYSYSALTSSVTDANGNKTATALNAQNQVASVTDATLTHTTSYVYDAFDDLTKVTDVSGNVTTATYDTRGRRTAVSDPDRGSWSFTYDVLSELTGQTDAKSQSTSFTYDLDGRPKRRIEPDMTSLWLFDSGGGSSAYGVGKPYRDCDASTCSSSTYQRTFSYNGLGQTSSVAIKADGTTYTYSMTYDSASGRLATLAYPSGFVAKYEYNATGYLADIKDNSSGTAVWTAGARDAELKLTQSTAGNGVITTNAYDPETGRVLSICASTNSGTCDGNRANFAYSWDPAGNLTERDDTYEGVSEKFCYDVLNRLTSSASGATCSTGANHVYEVYGSGGNIQRKSDVCTTSACMTYGSGAGPHALTGIAGTVNGIVNPSFTYDANGNMTAGLGRSYTWTSYNMVASISQGATTVGWTYSPDRLRLKMCVGGCTAPSSTTLYLRGPAYSEKVTAGSSTTWTDYIAA
ncbi:MAG TPA: FG-GAP-like repeat-containing protein, partial [Rhizomicrobium sp.]|nr:FG-GAP-like repeat-containing protein [Rhizomicrobium sp.]